MEGRAPPTTSAAPKFATYGTRELPGHKDKVYSVAWNCNGRRLASASLDTTILLWTIEPHSHGRSERHDRSLTGHKADVADLAWDPRNQDRLASASGDKTVRFWDARAGRSTSLITTNHANMFVCYNPRDSNEMACVALDSGDSTKILFLDLRKNAVSRFVHQPYEVNDVAFSKDGKLFFQTAARGSIEVYTWPELKKVYVLDGHTDTSYCVALDPSGRLLASGGGDSLALVWDLGCMACIAAFSLNDHPVKHLSFSHDSKYLAFGGDEQNTIMIEEVENGGLGYCRETMARIDSLSWHPSKMLLAYTGSYQAASRHGGTGGSSQYRGNVGIFAPP